MKIKYIFALLIPSICAISADVAQGFLPSPDIIKPGTAPAPPPAEVTIDDQVDEIFKPTIQELQYIINQLRGVRNPASAASLGTIAFDMNRKPLNNSAWDIKQLKERYERMKTAYGQAVVEKSAQRYSVTVSKLQNQLSAEIKRIHVNNYYGCQFCQQVIADILNPRDPLNPTLDINFNSLFKH